MAESADTRAGCSHDDENPSGEQANATAKRRMFNPFRSLKKKLFGHWWRKHDADTVMAAPSSGHSEVSLPVMLTPDVTTDSSTDVIGDVTLPVQCAASTSKNERCARQASLSVDSVIPRDLSATKTVVPSGSGRPQDLKAYASSLLWKSDSQLTRSFSSLNHTQNLSYTHEESPQFTFHQANAIKLEDEEVFFATSRPSADMPSLSASSVADTDCVDLSELCRSSGVVLSSAGAKHKRAVRPPGRRTLSAYKPYLVKRGETEQACVGQSSANIAVSETAEDRGSCVDVCSGGQTVVGNCNESAHAMPKKKATNSVELSANNIPVCRRKPPKVQQRKDETSRRRQTITVPDDVAGALANHGATKYGRRVGIQRELSMNLPPPSVGRREAESELAQAFSKFRRHASEITQPHEAAADTKPNSKAYGQQKKEAFAQDIPKPAQPGHSKQFTFTSQKSSAVDSQFNKDGMSQPRPAWKSMSSLASDDQEDFQKPLLMMTPQTFQSTEVRLASDAKMSSTSPTDLTSESHSSLSMQQNAACDGDIRPSAEMQKCSSDNSESRNTKKEVSISVQHATQLAGRLTSDRNTSSFNQTGVGSSTRLPLKTRNLSMNLERGAATVVPKPEPTSDAASKPELSTSTAAEAVASSISCDVSVVSATSRVDKTEESAEGRQIFTRQKSCPGKPEQRGNSTSAQLLHRSLDLADDGTDDIPHALEHLRSSAEWKTDESGNRTEVKLKKSHSITFKPHKNPTPTVTNQGKASIRSDKHVTSVANGIQSVNQDVSFSAKTEEAPAQSCGGIISESQSNRVQVPDHLASGLVQHIQSLKTGNVIAAKKLSTVALAGSRCDDRPGAGEPIWLALARQKTQKWTEGAV